MSGNLDRDIGELNGALRALIPALKGVEERLGELERDHSALDENVERLREWVKAIADKLKGVDVGDIDGLRARIEEIRKRIEGLRMPKERDGKDGIDWRGIVIWFLKTVGALLAAGIAGIVGARMMKGGAP